MNDVAFAIITKYARLRRSGVPIWCGASHREDVERANKGLAPHHKKIIFDSYEKAQACADELLSVLGGEPEKAYQCHRSESGHHHLTRDMSGAGKGRPRRLDAGVAIS